MQDQLQVLLSGSICRDWTQAQKTVSMWESLGLLQARISKGHIRDVEFKRETNKMNREHRSELVTSDE